MINKPIFPTILVADHFVAVLSKTTCNDNGTVPITESRLSMMELGCDCDTKPRNDEIKQLESPDRESGQKRVHWEMGKSNHWNKIGSSVFVISEIGEESEVNNNK